MKIPMTITLTTTMLSMMSNDDGNDDDNFDNFPSRTIIQPGLVPSSFLLSSSAWPISRWDNSRTV